MAYHLVVREPFDGHAKGDIITDAAEVIAVLASENEHHVAKIAAPDGAAQGAQG